MPQASQSHRSNRPSRFARPLPWLMGVLLAVLLTMLAGADAEPSGEQPATQPATQPEEQRATPRTGASSDPPAEGRIRVARLMYAEGKTAVCFADGFLATLARETEMPVGRQFEQVEIADEALFDYPFVVMTGEGAFQLSDREKAHLKSYIEQGGFVLASAGCSNARWAASFRQVMAELFTADALEPIAPAHPLFHSLYDIEQLRARQASDDLALHGLSLDGVLHVVFSPTGLNDTANAGEGCCCCGGNELRHASQLNANILAYALTH